MDRGDFDNYEEIQDKIEFYKDQANHYFGLFEQYTERAELLSILLMIHQEDE